MHVRFFIAKDLATAEKLTLGLALWDGQSSGTIVNVARLVARVKPAVVYIAPITVKNLPVTQRVIRFVCRKIVSILSSATTPPWW
ncbi:MAG TPA: hypothetical protein VEU30_08135 [Thermoanaerobaculia bacterium]|nr:hypothetical protein [Thermoanaerobaculia bacterium]